MNIICLDLEGVLIPEIWINFADKVGIEALRATTRDIPDYDELMRFRLNLLEKHDFRIQDIQVVINALEPLAGAVQFVNQLRADFQLIILSDTFQEFAWPMMRKLSLPTLFCHELLIDKGGRIIDYKLRKADHKRETVKRLQELNFSVVAAGDSYNDITMLAQADQGILYCPPQKVIDEFPQYPIAKNYAQLRSNIDLAIENMS